MFLKLGPRRRDFPAAALIPNLLTTLALCCGLASLHYSLQLQWDKAMAAIVLSGVFDALDGRAARLLRVTSKFGAVLDSLSDFLSFGVAPALLLQQWMYDQDKLNGRFRAVALTAFMTYALAAALRLARFTADTPKPARGDGARTEPEPELVKPVVEKPAQYFTGMATPAAAGCALAPVMLARSDTIAYTMPAWGVAAWTFVVGLLMISRVPMFSLKSVRLTRRAVAPVLLTVGILVVGLLRDPWLTIAGISAAYLLTVPFTVLATFRRGRTDAAGGEPRSLT